MKRSFSDSMAQSRVENLLKPLSNPIRLRIIYVLAERTTTYTELLNILDLESGSFYWHIKKMTALVEQTEDKRYQLSELGRNAYQLIFMGSMKKEEEYIPPWFDVTLNYVKKILNASNWLMIQQILLILLFTTVLFDAKGLYQWGTRVAFDDGFSFLQRLGSIILSLLVINIVEIFIIIVGKYLFDRNNPPMPFKPILRLFVLNFIFLSPILLSGIISGLVVFTYPTIIDDVYLQVILNVITIMLTVLLSSALLVVEFDFSFKNAVITGLITFYPVVFISFIFL